MKGAALMALSIMVLAALVSPAQAQSVQPQIDLTAPIIVGPNPEWIEGNPVDTQFAVTVENPGSAPISYRIEYWWIKDGRAVPFHGDRASSFNASTLDAQSSQTHVETWNLQPGQDQEGVLEARAFIVHQRSNSIAPSASDITRTELYIPLREVSISTIGPVLNIAPEDTGFFRLAVQNDGSIHERVELTQVSGINDGRFETFIDPPMVVVAPGESAYATFYVSFVPDGDFSSVSGDYVVRADPGFGSRPTAVTPTVSASAEYNAPQRSFTFDSVTPPSWGIPAGQTRTATLTLHNDGSTANNFTFHWSSPSSDWDTSIVPDRIALFPGETRQVTFSISAPDSATPADVPIDIKASGMGGSHSLTMPWRVIGPQPEVKGIHLESTPYAGLPVTVVVTLANPGEQATSNAELRLTVTNSTGAVTLEQPAISLLAGGEEEFTFDLVDAGPGGLLELEATWTSQGSPNAILTEWVHAPNVAITTPVLEPGEAGETIAYRIAPYAFQVQNTGNAAEEVSIQAHAEHGVVVLEGVDEFTLVPGQTRTVPVRHTLPDDGQTVDRLTFNVTLGATGRIWTSGIDVAIIDETPPLLTIGELPTHWHIATPLDVGLEIVDHSDIEEANVTVTDPSGTSTAFAMDQAEGGASKPISFPVIGVYTIQFTVQDAAGNNATSDIFEIEATAYAPPVVALGTVGEISAASVINFSIQETLPLQRVWIVMEQGSINWTHNISIDAREVSLAGAVFDGGPVRVTVFAQDTHGATSKATGMASWAASAVDSGFVEEQQESPFPVVLVAIALLATLGAMRRASRKD